MAEYEDGCNKDPEHRLPVYRMFKRVLPASGRILTVGDYQEFHDSRIVQEVGLNPAKLTIVNNDSRIHNGKLLKLVHPKTEVLYADLQDACETMASRGSTIHAANLDLQNQVSPEFLSMMRACGRADVWAKNAIIVPNVVCARDGHLTKILDALAKGHPDATQYKKHLRALMAVEAFMYDRNDDYKVLEHHSYKRDDGICMPMVWCAFQLTQESGERDHKIKDAVRNVLGE